MNLIHRKGAKNAKFRKDEKPFGLNQRPGIFLITHAPHQIGEWDKLFNAFFSLRSLRLCAFAVRSLA
jgi:hypothetical protein